MPQNEQCGAPSCVFGNFQVLMLLLAVIIAKTVLEVRSMTVSCFCTCCTFEEDQNFSIPSEISSGLHVTALCLANRLMRWVVALLVLSVLSAANAQKGFGLGLGLLLGGGHGPLGLGGLGGKHGFGLRPFIGASINIVRSSANTSSLFA
mgnify:CR=1 FL=1